MSQGERIPLADAEALAHELVEILAPACERIEIAGSIRRRRSHVADIEIVAIPKVEMVQGANLWGEAEPIDLLQQSLGWLHGRVDLRHVAVHRADDTTEYSLRDGRSYKALEYRGFPVDLFITDRDRWGVIFALRTGPGDWNIKLVEQCKRYFRRVEGGRVLHLGRPVPTPEERDFFEAIGQPWLEPPDRAAERVHLLPPRVPA